MVLALRGYCFAGNSDKSEDRVTWCDKVIASIHRKRTEEKEKGKGKREEEKELIDANIKLSLYSILGTEYGVPSKVGY